MYPFGDEESNAKYFGQCVCERLHDVKVGVFNATQLKPLNGILSNDKVHHKCPKIE